MKVLISGASGLVGKALTDSLRAEGHDVRRLVRRRPAEADAVYWNPVAGELDASALVGIDAIVHLAGENVASGRWTAAKKRRILESRVAGTGVIAAAIAATPALPILVSASAIGFYGDRGEEAVDEASVAGAGFLADVCQRWEAAAAPAIESGARVAFLRIGIVLTKDGGALAKMLTPFRLGLGGIVGNGRQMMSWIHLTDLVGVIEHVLTQSDLSGPVNAVTPQPVSNREFTATLGRVLGRPTWVPMPAPAVRLAFGEMGQELLLASTRVVPTRLVESGYSFQFHGLESALRQELGR